MKYDQLKTGLLFSVVIPAYNEENTLRELLNRVERAPLPPNISREIIVVDDGSKDRTPEILKNVSKEYTIIRHPKNMGLGASITDGLRASSGDITLIQDADLEYDPNDYQKLIQPIIEGRADVVNGSRLSRWKRPPGMRVISWLANIVLTLWSNLFTGLWLTDMETCYKVFDRPVLDAIKGKLVSQGFNIEPEMASLIKKFRVVEVPVSYNGRSVLEGKKVHWKDGFSALYAIVRFNVFR